MKSKIDSLLASYERFQVMYAVMADAVKEALHKWEKEYIRVATYATSD